MGEQPPPVSLTPPPSLQSSATAQRLALGVSVVQRECLTALFCPSASSADGAISSVWEEAEGYEAECMHRAVRMSVGLPDVPPCSLAAFDCPNSPLRARFPCPEVLQAEEFLVACSLDSVSDAHADEDAIRIALQRALHWDTSAQHRSRLPPLPCQRLPAILHDLLMQTSSRALHKHVYELEPEGHLARLRPAGELLLALLEVCLDICSKEADDKAPLPIKANPRERGGDGAEECCLLDVVGKLKKKVPGDLRAQDLQLFLTRLRAESEGLAALKGIATQQPVASLLSLEQLMQRPDLQHLPSFQASPNEVLREAFYGCLLRCFSVALAHSSPEGMQPQQEDQGCTRLIEKCREALRRAGLWQTCREELEADPSRTCLSSCCKDTAYLRLARDNKGSNGSALLQRRQRQQQQQRLLLLPPERCEATAKALCSFLFRDLQPASPWLRPPPNSASWEGGGIDLVEKETKPFAAVSSVGTKGESSEWCGDPSTTHVQPLQPRLWAQLRALDENLRPSSITAARQRKLHRLLVSWLKRKACSGAEWLGCCQAVQTGRDALSLVPLLLPYGSSVSGFGAWASDLDLSLLLPCCREASTEPPRKTSSLQSLKRCVDSEQKETDAGNSSSSSIEEACCCCCCSCCAADMNMRGEGGIGRVGLRASWSREAQANVLSRLKEALTADPQMQSAFVDLEVVIPSSAPPVLRGIHLQRKRRKKGGGASARLSLEAETEGGNSKSLDFLPPLAHSEEPSTEGDLDVGRRARDSQDSGDNEPLLCCSASQPEDSGRESQSLYGGAARGASSSSSDLQADEGPSQNREGSEQEDALNIGSVPSQATHRNLNMKDLASASGKPCTQVVEKSSGQGAGGTVAVSFDVTVGSALGPLNSLLLRAYARCCPLLPPLARIIKHWADCRGLTGTRDGNLSSYAWSLLVIFFALSTSPPLISSLQPPPLSLSPQHRRDGPPLTRNSPLGEGPITRTPVELISGCHSVWFLDANSEIPLGSRVADLLRLVFRGSTEALLLQLVQRYIPGHVVLLPPANRKGRVCPQESERQAALRGLPHESRRRGLRRRHHGRHLRGSELSEEQWQTLASLFHAFFVFYGFQFNCCALLVSLHSPPLCCKRYLYKKRRGSKSAEKIERPGSAAAEPASFSNVNVKSLGSSHKSSLNCLPPCSVSTRDGAPNEEAQKEGKESGSLEDALHARAIRGAASPRGCGVSSEEDEWRLIVEGREHRGQREDLLRLLETLTEGGIEPARSSAFEIEVEDPIEAGRLLRCRKTKGTELFLYEVRRAEHLLRKG
ncbi:hypothetical protein Emag_005041 [Eimeria magna]